MGTPVFNPPLQHDKDAWPGTGTPNAAVRNGFVSAGNSVKDFLNSLEWPGGLPDQKRPPVKKVTYDQYAQASEKARARKPKTAEEARQFMTDALREQGIAVVDDWTAAGVSGGEFSPSGRDALPQNVYTPKTTDPKIASAEKPFASKESRSFLSPDSDTGGSLYKRPRRPLYNTEAPSGRNDNKYRGYLGDESKNSGAKK
jgi:hypothetical protein